MREILFRGKRLDNGEWAHGDLAVDPDMKRTYIRWFYYFVEDGERQRDFAEEEVNPETVGQYTGLKDKNGTRIFEGDVLSDCVGDKFSVGWQDDDCQWVKDSCDCGSTIETSFDWFDAQYTEVVGNIHDNPELMEGE